MPEAWDWTLTTDNSSVSFGDDRSLVVVDSWSVDPGKFRIGDQENPRMDGVRFGRDFRSGQSVKFSMWINGGTEAAAMAGLSELAALWRNDSGRSRGGSLATLRHPRGRVAYGRPRGLVSDTQRVERGWATVNADFDCVNDLWYGVEESVTLGLVPEFTGGLPIPADVPFVLGGGTGQADRIVTVGGDVATWPVFELKGPIVDPWVDVPGVGRLVFTGSLAYDQTLEVDTRPWARWVKRNGFAFPGALQPSGARLGDMGLRPGSYQIIFGGYDPSGTSSLTVRVRPAFPSF